MDNPTFSFGTPGPAQIGVSNFFIENFQIPPFDVPIYQAAAAEYGVPWQVLCGIHSIETNFGQNLSVSSAGALGQMQFIPESWRSYGVDANNDGKKDPYSLPDAIFAAAHYLKAAGAPKDLYKAIFAYNHADWYVKSVMLRSKVVCGLPDDVAGALSDLMGGHFPVAAAATYADDVREKRISPTDTKASRATNIYAREGAPIIAVNDATVQAIGSSKALGRYVVLRDFSGNTFTYSQLGDVSPAYPTLKPVEVSSSQITNDTETKNERAPAGPATAGEQVKGAPKPGAPVARPRTPVDTDQGNKERLFAHPNRPAAYRSGGDVQVFQQRSVGSGSGFAGYFQKLLGLKRSDVVYKRLAPGAQLMAGTIIGHIGSSEGKLAPHLSFDIRPTGPGAPSVDAKPILDNWQLLEKTALYRAAGQNPFLSNALNPSIGQLLLMGKETLKRQVLNDQRIEIYDCGRRDIQGGIIDKRVLVALKALASWGLRPYVSTLRCGHSYYTSAGTVSEHSFGDAVDIAKINGMLVAGHQGAGSMTDMVVRRILNSFHGVMQPNQVITLMDYPNFPYAWAQGDHADHIHLGWPPQYGTNPKLAAQYNAALKPVQWLKLIDRINKIDKPAVPTKPSKYSLPAGRAG